MRPEYLFDYAGRRTSSWLEAGNTGNEGRIYWDGVQVAYRAADGTTYFDRPGSIVRVRSSGFDRPGWLG